MLGLVGALRLCIDYAFSPLDGDPTPAGNVHEIS